MPPNTLNDILSSIWKKLNHAVRSRHEAWHLATLATIRQEKPEIRTLVLRGVSETERLLWMHTDLRSPKCEDLKQSSAAALLFYDPLERWQLRLNGNLSLDRDSDLTESVWKKTSESAKRCYQGKLVPGIPSAELISNLPEGPVSSDLGRENFTRLLFKVSKMDWLFLKSDGHLRAQWIWEQEEIRGTWVVP